METHKIDQLFKQKLDRHSETVSADAFAKLQSQMKGKKQKKGFPWMIAASASILLVLSFGLVYDFNENQSTTLAQLDLSQSQIKLSSQEKMEIPEASKEVTEEGTKGVIKSSPSYQKQPPKELVTEEYDRMAKIEKVQPTNPKFETELIPKLKLSPQKYKNKVIVEIHYAYAEREKEENLLIKSNNKLKSLASEFSLAELRSAKNELFASALQFNKKENN